MYGEDDFLPLSGIQHFAFCRRQWALIHIEQAWSENIFTMQGALMHERVHDEELRERRGDLIIIRGLRVHSWSLGLTGICDAVEFHRANNIGAKNIHTTSSPCVHNDSQPLGETKSEGPIWPKNSANYCETINDGSTAPFSTATPLNGESGLWCPIPIEYKKGKSKIDDIDRLQLCAQAICLEEMLQVDIPQGYLYYDTTKSRERVPFDNDLRTQLNDISHEMHAYYARQYTPRVKPFAACRSCSLADLCIPKMPQARSVNTYIESSIKEMQ